MGGTDRRNRPPAGAAHGLPLCHQRHHRKLSAGDGKRNTCTSCFQSIMDNSPQAIFIKSTEGRYIHVNKQFCELLMLTELEIVGKTDDELFGKNLTTHYRNKEAQVIKTQTPKPASSEFQQ
jgi:PAS domain-containing protein